MGPLAGGGGSQNHVSILRNNNVALSNLRNGHVTLSRAIVVSLHNDMETSLN